MEPGVINIDRVSLALMRLTCQEFKDIKESRRIHAIKSVRERTQISLGAAKALTDLILDGATNEYLAWTLGVEWHMLPIVEECTCAPCRRRPSP